MTKLSVFKFSNSTLSLQTKAFIFWWVDYSLILPLGGCFLGQPDSNFRWGRDGVLGLPELSIPGRD